MRKEIFSYNYPLSYYLHLNGGSFIYQTLLWILAMSVSTATSFDGEWTGCRRCRVAVNIPASGPSVQFSEHC